MLMTLPWHTRLAALLSLVTAGIWFGVVQGLNYESNRRDAQELQRTRDGIAAADKESARREALGSAREVKRETIRVVYRTIKEKADENVKSNAAAYAACSLDADGLRQWNAANAGAAATVPGEPDYTLPAAAARSVWQPEGSAAQPHRGDGALRAMPGSVEQAGGM